MTKDDIIASVQAILSEKTIGSTPGTDGVGDYDLITVDGADTLVKWRQADIDSIEASYGVDALVSFTALLKFQLSVPVYEDEGGSMLIHVDLLQWIGNRGLSEEESRHLAEFNLWQADVDGAFIGLLNQAMGR